MERLGSLVDRTADAGLLIGQCFNEVDEIHLTTSANQKR